MDSVAELLDLADWYMVPLLVRQRYKLASSFRDALATALADCPPPDDPGYGKLWYQPETNDVWFSLGDGDEQEVYDAWRLRLQKIPEIGDIRAESEAGPPREEDWIKIGCCGATPTGQTVIRPPFADQLFRPLAKCGLAASPLTNTLVGSLLGGGAGYLGGAALEQLMPARYVQRGKLRKTLGLAGLAAGSLPGLYQSSLAYRQLGNIAGETGGKPPSYLDALITPTNDRPVDDSMLRQVERVQSGAIQHKPSGKLAEALAKYAADLSGISSDLRPIPLDAFGQAIWNDVHNPVRAATNPYGTKDPWGSGDEPLHTPPATAGAMAGVVAGLGEMYGGADILTPRHFIRGLAAAGLDLATARVAGGVLGVLGGLTPPAQAKLQDMGLWGGLIRGVAQSIFQ